MPEFQRYCPDARYCWAVGRSGFSRNDAASAAPATSVGSPFCTYPKPVAGEVGVIPSVTNDRGRTARQS